MEKTKKQRRAEQALARYHRTKVLLPKTTVEERFFSKVNKTPTCWLWLATKHRQGYGFFTTPKKVKILAHRFAYQWAKGPIPVGLVIDHLCKNTACVNPDHLEAVTQRENMRRSTVPNAKYL